MAHARYTNDEIVRRGEELYQERVRAQVEPEHTGKYLVLDIETGDYEIAPTAIEAIQRMKARHADPALYILRVGHQAAYRLGGRFLSGRA